MSQNNNGNQALLSQNFAESIKAIQGPYKTLQNDLESKMKCEKVGEKTQDSVLNNKDSQKFCAALIH